MARILVRVAHRMFVALYPPSQAVDVLAQRLDHVRVDQGGDDLVRWSDPRQWHLTLAFLASVAPDRVDRLCAELAVVASQHAPAPTVSIEGAGHFGSGHLWWALADDPLEQHWLTGLVRHVRRVCRAAGVAPDDSRWRPHITIGRVRRQAPPGTAARWTRALAEVSSRWTPDGLVLVTSVTGPVVRHTVTGRWSLADHQDLPGLHAR